MGAQQHNGGYNFTIAVDDCEEASLVLYPKGSGEVWKEIPLTEEFRTGGIAAVWIEHLDADDIEYNYRIDGKIITDPCAKAVTGRHVFGKNCRMDSGTVSGEFYQIKVPLKRRVSLYRIRI